MIDKLVRTLFKWDTLRYEIFAEVDLYNSLTRIINDPESMKTATAMWCDPDGWRGWTIKDNGNYFFNDIPETSFSSLMYTIMEKEGEK